MCTCYRLRVFWLAVFLYTCFLYAYMPPITHEREVHLSFRSDCDDFQNGILCEFPNANFSLLKDSQSELLMRGQTYAVSLIFEMPECPENLEHGMFMVIMKFYSRYGENVKSSSRTMLMRYKSYLHRIFETFFYIPTLLLGSTEQKQTLRLELFNSYQEDPYRPAMGAYIQVQSKKIRIYRSLLQIHASFTGLRYYLHHWPITSAVLGISTNMFFITMVLLIAYLNLREEPSVIQDDQEPKKRALREDLIRQKGQYKGEIDYMSSSSKPATKTAKSKLNASQGGGNVMESSFSSSASFSSAEDVSFGGGAEREGAVPQIRVSQHPGTGTDAGDLRFRHSTQQS